MTTIQKFEDLRCWKSARELAKMVYEITNDGAFQRDFGLRDQIRRAAVSVMSNIAEGFGSGSIRSSSDSSDMRGDLFLRLSHSFILHSM